VKVGEVEKIDILGKVDTVSSTRFVGQFPLCSKNNYKT